MPTFDYEQENTLKEILLTYMEKNKESELTKKAKELDILASFDEHDHTESAKEDIYHVIDDMDPGEFGLEEIVLTDKELDELVRIVHNYDYSDYNEYIHDQATEVLNKR